MPLAHGRNTSTPAVTHICLQNTCALPAQRQPLTQAWKSVPCLFGCSWEFMAQGWHWASVYSESWRGCFCSSLRWACQVWDEFPLLLPLTLIMELKLRKSKLKDKRRRTPTHTITTPGFRQRGEHSFLSEALCTLFWARQSIDISEVCCKILLNSLQLSLGPKSPPQSCLKVWLLRDGLCVPQSLR